MDLLSRRNNCESLAVKTPRCQSANWLDFLTGCKPCNRYAANCYRPFFSRYPAIALTEGVPDFISVLHLALAFGVGSCVAPVCFSGASVTVPEDALPFFWGKRIRIFAHQDQAGQAAADRWTLQFQP
jgi:hypothetical protein